jgi:hypothetical protein
VVIRARDEAQHGQACEKISGLHGFLPKNLQSC